ncbi:MAG: hypothetical protein WHS88_08230 [Anaerohalosphaeraceae bacterium]
MKKQERYFLIQGLPVYLVLLILIAGMVILYYRKLSKHGNEPLPVLISKNLRGFQPPYQSIDEVINSRKTWEPVLPDWQGRLLPGLSFFLPNGEIRQLEDYRGRDCLLLLGATWFQPFRLQINQILHLLEGMEGDKPSVLVLTTESSEKMETFAKEMSFAAFDVQIGKIDNLPEPYSLPDGFPCLFFIDAQGRLKLAVVGLIPIRQMEAVCRLPLPERPD